MKNKASNIRQKISKATSSNKQILQKLTETLIKEEKEDLCKDDVFGKYMASELKGLSISQKRLAKNEITSIPNRLALEQLVNELALLDKSQ